MSELSGRKRGVPNPSRAPPCVQCLQPRIASAHRQETRGAFACVGVRGISSEWKEVAPPCPALPGWGEPQGALGLGGGRHGVPPVLCFGVVSCWAAQRGGGVLETLEVFEERLDVVLRDVV